MAVTGARPQENQAEPFRRRFTGPGGPARFSLGPWMRLGGPSLGRAFLARPPLGDGVRGGVRKAPDAPTAR